MMRVVPEYAEVGVRGNIPECSASDSVYKAGGRTGSVCFGLDAGNPSLVSDQVIDSFKRSRRRFISVSSNRENALLPNMELETPYPKPQRTLGACSGERLCPKTRGTLEFLVRIEGCNGDHTKQYIYPSCFILSMSIPR
jgi:hypothetical protein